MRTLRLLLASPFGLCLTGIRLLLERVPGIRVVAEARTGREALRQAASLSPDVAVLDEGLPLLNGIDVAERLLRRGISSKVLLLAEHDDPETLGRAVRAGVSAVVLKWASAEEMARALRRGKPGAPYFCRMISAGLAREARRRAQRRDPRALTPRQREVLQLLAEGGSTKQIARSLGLSIKTVETHRAQIMERLAIFDVPGLVRYAVRTGLTRL
jgi:DNA-binding NarL/FixJ family response regulator